ncbi:MAG: bifunctional adenosylcobinamide kinase/adenosylcobinamide-phosphate guanylyltransferase, partial [Oscillospiraceae bacterium]
MIVFVSGGCKNGKSTYAEKIAVALSKNAKPLYYIATMSPTDKEDEARIVRHQQSRKGLGFTTIEQPTDIDKIVDKYDVNGTYLLDSTTALLSNEMFLSDGSINKNSADSVSTQLTKLITKVKNIVIVSDYVYSDAVLYDQFIKLYQ